MVYYNMLSHDIDRLVQERRNSRASAMELHFSCTNPSTWEWQIKCKSEYKLTKDTPYLTLMDVLWNVFSEYFVENHCYKEQIYQYIYGYNT